MSGGSYNYLYSKSSEDLFEYGTTETLDAMATRLIELGHVDVAKETLQLKQIIIQSKVRAEVISERLSDVWKSVEWYDSADRGIDSVDKAISKYRGEDNEIHQTE